MEPQVFLIKINRVFASRNSQIYIVDGYYRFSCEFAQLAFFNYFLMNGNSCWVDLVIWSVDLFIILPLGFILFIHLVAFLIRVVNTLYVEPNFAHAVIFVEFLICSFNNDVVLVDS